MLKTTRTKFIQIVNFIGYNPPLNPCLSTGSGLNVLKFWLLPFFDMDFQKKKTLEAEIRTSIFLNSLVYSDSATKKRSILKIDPH